jgi:UDP-glucose 4-epimerase
MVTEKLLARGHEVVGIDKRGWPDAPRGVSMHRADIRKRPAEEVFRNEEPDALVHMATVTHLTTRAELRYRINLGGTQKLFEYCHEYGVGQAVFVGRHTIYGAAPDAPLYRTESDPPLAVSTFPDLADLVAADLFAGSALWRWPELKTSVLRLVYTLGATQRSTLGSFLLGSRVPMVMGFDPLFQFMHELDAAEAIVIALETELRGVFNVAGPPPVPLSLLCRAVGRKSVRIPAPLYSSLLGKFGLPYLPPGAVAHIKHPIVIDDAAFRAATDFQHHYDEVQVMESFRLLDSVQ